MANSADIQAILTEEQFRSAVSYRLNRQISRTTLFNYRKELGQVKQELTLGFALVMAHYVDLRAKRVAADRAKQLTIKFAKENNL